MKTSSITLLSRILANLIWLAVMIMIAVVYAHAVKAYGSIIAFPILLLVVVCGCFRKALVSWLSGDKL